MMDYTQNGSDEGHVISFQFGQIIDIISEIVQDRDIVTWNTRGNHTWHIE